jgi:hypothetical protein
MRRGGNTRLLLCTCFTLQNAPLQVGAAEVGRGRGGDGKLLGTLQNSPLQVGAAEVEVVRSGLGGGKSEAGAGRGKRGQLCKRGLVLVLVLLWRMRHQRWRLPVALLELRTRHHRGVRETSLRRTRQRKRSVGGAGLTASSLEHPEQHIFG